MVARAKRYQAANVVSQEDFPIARSGCLLLPPGGTGRSQLARRRIRGTVDTKECAVIWFAPVRLSSGDPRKTECRRPQ